MVVGVLFLFLFLMFLSYAYNRSLVDPSFITSGLWFTILFVYNFVPHGLYPISDKFYYAIVLWVVPFCICSLFFSKKNFKVSGYLTGKQPNSQIFRRLLPFILVFDVLLIAGLVQLSGGYSAKGVAAGVRAAFIGQEGEIPGYINFFMYFAVVGTSIVIAYMFDRHSKSLGYKLLIVLQLILLLCLGNKGGIASIGFAILFLFYHYRKLNLKKIFAFAIAIVGLMTIVVLSRGDTDESTTVLDYLLIYTLSPIPAFDMVLNSEIPIIYGTPGASTFDSFVKLFNTLGFDLGVTPHYAPSWWVYVPLPTNVFTHLCTFYLDFGYWGIFIFALFFGCSWGILYNLMKRNIQLFVIIYAIFFYTLFLTFFADYVFTFLSLSIQYIVIAHFLFLKFKFSAHHG